MADNIVGMMWNCNEADILRETLASAITKVDSLFIADDNSTDGSWEIIQDFASKHKDKVEHIQNRRTDSRDKGQRQAMLSEIQRRYKPENTWVQIIESDIMILDTDIREAINDHAVLDIALSWQTLNAVRKPGTWGEVDTYPNWTKPIVELMPYAHWMEVMLYTFRPLPKVSYNLDTWRPWPRGFTNYTDNPNQPIMIKRRGLTAPLLAHYGYRGPTHFFKKFSNISRKGDFHPKYKSWNMSSVEKITETVSFFNGHWNPEDQIFPMSRGGWRQWRKG